MDNMPELDSLEVLGKIAANASSIKNGLENLNILVGGPVLERQTQLYNQAINTAGQLADIINALITEVQPSDDSTNSP